MAQPGTTPQSPDPDGRPRVVVGVDGGDASIAALRRALEEGSLRHAVVEVVHAWQFPFELAVGAYAVPTPAGDMEQWAEQVVDDALAAVPHEGVEIRRRVCNGGAALVLADAARGAELLVVGTRGHSRMTGLFLGSVSQYLAVHAPCPVLVVHAPRHGEPTESAPSAGSTPAGSPTPVPQPVAEDKNAAGAPGSAELVEIPEDECLALLAGKTVGRLVVVPEGVPVAVPVNFVLDGRTVAVRTDPGMILDWGTLGHVAFEVDDIDEGTRQGWSVLVQGIGRDVTDGVDVWSERLRDHDLQPWAGGERHHWIALSSPRITGRRIVRHVGSRSPLAPV